jgi:hypothetical protein
LSGRHPQSGPGIAAFLERGQVLPLPLFGLAAPVLLVVGLWLARVLGRATWVVLWAMLAPWFLFGPTWLAEASRSRHERELHFGTPGQTLM